MPTRLVLNPAAQPHTTVGIVRGQVPGSRGAPQCLLQGLLSSGGESGFRSFLRLLRRSLAGCLFRRRLLCNGWLWLL